MTFIAAVIMMVAAGPGSDTPAPSPAGTPGAGRQPTVVTSVSLDMDYEKNVATFIDNVHVADSSGELWADRVVVHFDPEKRVIRQLVATGRKVIISARGKRSMSRKAVYTADDGRIVLTGEPRILQGRNVYAADKITIFKDQDRTLFEPKARLTFYSDEELKEMDILP